MVRVLQKFLASLIINRETAGEKLSLAIKDMGSCEIFPQTVQHNCNGRFIVVCGDGEYIIYTSQALRNKAFGQALDFVWSAVYRS